MTLVTAWDQIASFATVFLGIFIEATPFLLLGTIASGMIEVFVSQDDLARIIPRRVLPATVVGSLIGFVFPVCECGVVPLTQRLYKKGLPIAAGIAFLLAAPIVNPIVIASTFAAYGWGRVLWARLVLGLIVSVSVGLIFSLNPAPANMMRRIFVPSNSEVGKIVPLYSGSLVTRLQIAFRIAGDEFFDMARYLVIGSTLAALVQTFVPPRVLLAAGSGPLASVVVMQGVAFVLSVCSTVDAFLSLAFVNTFSTGAILSFLVFGPMVDIKSTLMFLSILKPKVVFYLILLAFLLVTLLTVFINVILSW